MGGPYFAQGNGTGRDYHPRPFAGDLPNPASAALPFLGFEGEKIGGADAARGPATRDRLRIGPALPRRRSDLVASNAYAFNKRFKLLLHPARADSASPHSPTSSDWSAAFPPGPTKPCRRRLTRILGGTAAHASLVAFLVNFGDDFDGQVISSPQYILGHKVRPVGTGTHRVPALRCVPGQYHPVATLTLPSCAPFVCHYS